MPETISLRAYIDRLDELLRTNVTDEVIHHCRHILKYFPRCVAVYRLLGQALIFSARWDEASTILRRVLSVLPDDYTAHIGLSEVYVQRSRANDAIWHLERAYEQDPNNTEIINTLRDLYKRYQNADHPRLQLTTAAVARQYARNNMDAQAVDTLRSTLERMPDRVDLRLLLAETLWDMGAHIEAAETAMDVLQVLPDCLGANRIMTELWLAEGRPTDAQRYLSRLEAADPYLALELAQGSAPDDAFKLEELDYRRFAQARMATDQPAWLQDVTPSDGDFAALFGGAGTAPPAASAAPDWIESPPAAAETFDDLLDDWLMDDQQLTAQADELFDDDDLMQDIEKALAAEQPPANQLPDWLQSDKPKTPQQSEADEAMMWLRASTFGDADSAANDTRMTSSDADPLGWLRDSGVEIDDQAQRERMGIDDEPVAFESADADPMAWLISSGIELTDEQPAAPLADDEDDEMLFQDPASNPYSWMSQYEGLETTDDEDAESAADQPLENHYRQDTASPSPAEQASGHDAQISGDSPPDGEEEDLFNWLGDDSLLNEKTIPIPEQPLSETESFDNLRLLQLQSESEVAGGLVNTDADGDEDMNDKEFPDWLSSSSGSTESNQDDDWLTAGSESPGTDMPDWLREMQPQAQNQPADDDDAELEWMSSSGGETAADDEMPAWLRGMHDDTPHTLQFEQQQSSSSAEDSGFEWMAPEDEPAASSGDLPDWMREIQPAAVEPAAEAAASGFEWMSGLDEAEEEAAPVSASLAAPEPDEELGWLNSLQPAGESAADDEGDFEWMSGFGGEEAEAEPAAPQPAASDLSWLTDMEEAEEEPAVPQPAVTTELSWLTDMEEEAAEQPAEEEVSWLSAMQPEPEEEAEELEFEWMSTVEDEAAPAQSGDTGELPEWLTEMEPAASAEPTIEDEEEAGFEWMSTEEFAEEDEEFAEEIPASLGMTGLLQELSQSKPAAETPLEEAVEEDSQWMSEFEEEAVAAGEGQEFSWLMELTEPEAQPAEPELEAEAAIENEFAAFEQAEAPVASGEVPDWLQGLGYGDPENLQSFAEQAVYDEAEAIGDDEEDWTAQFETVEEEGSQPAAVVDEDMLAALEWPEDEFDAVLTESAPVDELEHAPAENAPDWLNAMVPGLDLNYAAEEDIPLEHQHSTEQSRREFGWLLDIVDAETGMTATALEEEAAPAQAPRGRFIFSRAPAWLRGLRPASQSSAKDDWTKNDQPADEKDLDLPDWLK